MLSVTARLLYILFLKKMLYLQGMIPKNGLGPMTSFKSPTHIDVSSFSAPQPIGIFV